MVEPDKIRGYVGAHDQLQKPKEDVADPEKFKKVLKVEASTESEKREQRKKKRSEHEGETDEEADVGPNVAEKPVAETAFSEILGDRPDKGDILTGQTGSQAARNAPMGTDADLSYGETQGQGLRKTIYSAPQEPGFGEETPPPEEEAPPLPATPPQPSAQLPPPPPSEQQAPPPPPPSGSEQQQMGQQAQQPQQPSQLGPPTTGDEEEVGPTLAQRRKAHAQEAEQKAKGEMAGLPEEKKKVETYKEKKLREKYEQLEKAHQAKTTSPKTPLQQPKQEGMPVPVDKAGKTEGPVSVEKRPLPEEVSEKQQMTPSLSREPTEKTPDGKPSPLTPEEIIQKESLTPPPAFAEEVVPQRQKRRAKEKDKEATSAIKGAERAPLLKAEGKGHGDSSGGKKEKEQDTQSMLDEIAASLKPEMTQTHFTPAEAEQTPESKLSPKVYELFEKMVGLITIQKIDGVERTTVTIDMKGSVFNGAQLILERSPTAQDTFNIELKASPEGVALFNQNVSDLVAAFQKKDFDFRVNIKRASLQKRYAVQKGRESSTS